MQKKDGDSERYSQILLQYPRIVGFLDSRNPLNIVRMESKWRKQNLILRIACEGGTYVFKQLNDSGEKEIERMKLLAGVYPGLVPDIHLQEKEAYLMDYVDGKSFFELTPEERLEKINQGGKVLVQAWKGKDFPKSDIRSKVQASFQKYRTKSARFFSPGELEVTDFSAFQSVPETPSHNDLNAANMLYNGTVKLIDPSEEGYNDLARDTGRYLASTFFNNYDYFGQDAKASLEIAHAFLCNFPPEMLERARFYIGESFLSFMNFGTISDTKPTLKKLAVAVLTKSQPVLASLEQGLQ